jgi:hypothetical protein
MAVLPPGTITRFEPDDEADPDDDVVRDDAEPVVRDGSDVRLTAVERVGVFGGAARRLVLEPELVPEPVVEPELPEPDDVPDEPVLVPEPEPRPVAWAAACAGTASAAATAKEEINWSDLVITGPPEIQDGTSRTLIPATLLPPAMMRKASDLARNGPLRAESVLRPCPLRRTALRCSFGLFSHSCLKYTPLQCWPSVIGTRSSWPPTGRSRSARRS